MKRPLQVVTNSELQGVRNCSQLHGFAYVDLLRPHVEAPYFAHGRALHAGAEAAILEAFDLDHRTPGYVLEDRLDAAIAAGKKRARALLDEYREKLKGLDMHPEKRLARLEQADERATMVVALVERYVRGAAADFERLIPIAIEKRFEVPIPDAAGGRRTRVRLRGVIDVVWYDPDQGDLVIDDHKTTKKGADTFIRKLGHDPQLCGYLWAVRWMLSRGQLWSVASLRAVGMSNPQINALLIAAKEGTLATGRVRYNVLRKKLPTVPRVLKNGTITTDQSIDTTPGLYAAALERQEACCLACGGTGEVPKKKADPPALVDCKPCKGTGDGQPRNPKQAAILARLHARGDTWFQRLEVWKTDAAIERWRREAVTDAKRIRELKRSPMLRTRNLWHCTGPGGNCDYAALCAQTTRASDGPPELLEAYRVADTPHEEWIEAARTDA